MKFLKAGLTAALIATAMTAPALAADITGAGATFPAPVYAAWGDAYKAKAGNALD